MDQVLQFMLPIHAQSERRPSDHINQETRKASEQVAETVRTISETAERTNRVGAETLQRSTEQAKVTWQEANEAASRMTQRSMERFSKMFGLDGETAQEALQQTSGNLQVIMESTAVIASGLREVTGIGCVLPGNVWSIT
jgi:cell division septum initiation protein DivIVA